MPFDIDFFFCQKLEQSVASVVKDHVDDLEAYKLRPRRGLTAVDLKSELERLELRNAVMVHICIYVCAYVCMYVYTCYVLISSPMPIHYVLAAVFASCFYVLIYLLQEWGHIFDYVRLDVFASCFYVLFKIRFVSKATQGGTLKHEL